MADIAVAVVHDRIKNRLLVVRRSDDSDLRGWVFPGGKRELKPYGFKTRMESVAATARRELAEETGLNLRERGTEIYRRKHPETGVFISYVYFCVTINRELKTRCNDSSIVDCAWVSVDQIRSIFSGKVSEVVLNRIRDNSVGKHCVDPMTLNSDAQCEFLFPRDMIA